MIEKKIRPGCQDIWNAFMVQNTNFTIDSDMPLCSYIQKSPPKYLISYEDAKHIHKQLKNKEPDYHKDAFIHFYIDDHKFDGKQSSIWLYPYEALDIIRHFSGIITPDFSTNIDFPDPIKRYNHYRMLAFGAWINNFNIPIIYNVRWGTEETWDYCFDGIPSNSIIAIGTVASGLKKIINRKIFIDGLYHMVKVLNPNTIIIYGSSNYYFFDELRKSKIKIITFPSKTNLAFSNRKDGVFIEQTR